MARTPAKRKNNSSSAENIPRAGPGPSPGHPIGRPSPMSRPMANDRGPTTPVGPPKYKIATNVLPVGRHLSSSLVASLAQDGSTGGAIAVGTRLTNRGDVNLPSNPNRSQLSSNDKSGAQDIDRERSSSARAASKTDRRLNLMSPPRVDTLRGDSLRIQSVPDKDHVQTQPARSMEVRSPPSKRDNHRKANINSPASTVSTATMKSMLSTSSPASASSLRSNHSVDKTTNKSMNLLSVSRTLKSPPDIELNTNKTIIPFNATWWNTSHLLALVQAEKNLNDDEIQEFLQQSLEDQLREAIHVTKPQDIKMAYTLHCGQWGIKIDSPDFYKSTTVAKDGFFDLIWNHYNTLM